MEQTSSAYYPKAQGLYNPANEHDACGVGMVVDTKAIPSHDIVKKGITILERILHRGATGCDPETGDGAGMLLQIPDEFFQSAAPCELPELGKYAVGMIFLPKQEDARAVCMKEIQSALDTEGFNLLGTRVVPVQEDKIGKMARESAPAIEQIFITSKDDKLTGEKLERQLYVLRRVMEHNVQAALPELGDKFYICSLSARTIVYKGLLMAPQLPLFYLDLNEPNFKSCMAIVHQRYSTNTFPSWPLAHPFRYMAHNGEVNTLRGNLNQMSALEGNLESPLFGPDIKKLLPIIPGGQSDSASLDNALELLTTGGRSMTHSMMMLVPQAFGHRYFLGEDLRGFFEYHAGIMSPWDGPAAVCFSNGTGAGALIDRNGLRPARYELTDEGLFILASEAGVLDTDPKHVIKRGCLTPGDILWIDFEKKRISYNDEVKTSVARHKPYRRWCKENHIEIHGFFDSVDEPERHSTPTTLAQQSQFGYTQDEISKFIAPMANSGHEPLSAMGNDAALAVLSERPQNLFNYFKQQFAQVTNPPIDPIREQLVMSMTTFIGNPANILEEKPEMARNIKLARPILTTGDLAALKANKEADFRCMTLPTGFSTLSAKGLEEALDELAIETEKAIEKGYRIIILSDRDLSYNEAPIPSLLAVAAVNAKLCDLGVRTSTGVIAETGEARQVMHFALLLGYGATAVCPWLAFNSIAKLAAKGELNENVSATKAVVNYIEAIDFGLLKIMSKMGISTLRSYRGAQIFEAIGLGDEVVEKYFPGTASRIGGVTLADIARESSARLAVKKELKFNPTEKLEDAGIYKWKRGGEKHVWTSKVISALQKSLRNEDYAQYKVFSALVTENAETLCNLRGLFDFKTNPIAIEEVESEEKILARFVSGAMSLGAISKEAHEAIAIAMNRIGGMSNSGEGGEDPIRYTPRENGDNLCSAIKQIASGRFGVTAEYLANARELQIKVAQGAKPGEGGQLPGTKVNEEIARLRHSTPGVSLISPPPHHDIYSIEDLAQLIFDLRNSNPEARVSVKLVSEVGVGTVAAGVAKGGADMVLISGHDGGTGASPLTSISYAGMPWELGLAETHQTLVINGLRDKIRVQTDGLITNGRDVVIATLLGAEEFGFATSVLIALGCVMARVCDKNTCPVGVATQDEKLRGRMRGKPENVINYLTYIARETREYLAAIGMRSIDEAVGRADLLKVDRAQDYWKTQNLDFSKIIRPESQNIHGAAHENNDCEVFDKQYLPELEEAIENGTPIALEMPISNTDRSVGTRLSYYIAKKHGNAGLAEDTISLTLKGTAGQSFGAFLSKGVTLHLKGQANDYVGKGLSGGKIILTPFEGTKYNPCDNVIAGNVHLYGATGGQLYVHGKVGERFAVRNSGAEAVIEGAGDHCCEYMTGGTVVLLGESGHNFGAGMSGGLAFVWDRKHIFDRYCNLDMIDLDPVKDARDVAKLRRLIEEHAAYTGSARARAILANFDNELPNFVKVFPQEYRRVLTERAAAEAAAKAEAEAPAEETK